ncbi:cysteine desulfurase [Moniliophthora roreri MCA 2997]|uniref:Cysteine desulfurase n=1 Tax=Moniliophthora roreri (strain MCA 2997) TaxID=1381753 RepID=V2X201_MONRO|nr:cysteine desulfurase [Moniliophthora roreri MCA 2997]
MGNTPSSNLHSNRHRTLRPQRSAPILSRISLGCASAGSSVFSSDSSHATSQTFIKEKSIHSSRPSECPPLFPPPARLSTHVAYAPTADVPSADASIDYDQFLREFPEYRLTWIVDTLRRSDYRRLERVGETYVDYMGGSLYPESLIRVHTEFLSDNVLGNTHSVSNSSKLSLQCSEDARTAILMFFKAPPEYTVVFTSNASGALKLVGESYPFIDGSSYVLGADSHNSVHGIRDFATNHGARVCYIPSTNHGGFDPAVAKDILLQNKPLSKDLTPSLFALTGQSNITNSKNPLSVLDYASSLGYHTLLDAAALAPTSPISLKENPVDAMAVSFYKMFGFPTGVGALVVKKSFLQQLKRPWFAGGTVDVVQVPGNIATMAHQLHEQFEDGTINYLTLPAVTDGLRLLSAYLPFLPVRLSCLTHYLVTSLAKLRHEITDIPVVRVLSRRPRKRPRSIGEQSDTGSTVSVIFSLPSGEMMPNSFIEHAASRRNISLRTGCMCNPGGAAAILNIEDDMKRLYPGVTRKDFEEFMGRELGVVRISLGLGSNFQDVWNVIQFASLMGIESSRQALWDDWTEASGVGQAI